MLHLTNSCIQTRNSLNIANRINLNGNNLLANFFVIKCSIEASAHRPSRRRREKFDDTFNHTENYQRIPTVYFATQNSQSVFFCGGVMEPVNDTINNCQYVNELKACQP